MNRAMDNRGLATGLISFVAILVVGAFFIIFFTPAINQVSSGFLNATSDPQATKAIERRQNIWQLVGFFIMFSGGVFVIARAVFEGRGGV